MKCCLLGVLIVLSLSPPAFANLCEKSNITDRHRAEAKLIRGEYFARSANSSLDYVGDDEYNAWILACNRQRDNRGKEIDAEINPNTGGKFADDLPEVSIKGQFSYYGNSVAANAFTSLEYRYRLRRSQGKWIVTLPIELDLPGVVYGRDQRGQPVAVLKNRIDISQFLAVKLGLMSHDGYGTLECDQGREKWKTAPNGVMPRRFVDMGFIGPAHATYEGVACRLPMDRVVPGGKLLLDEFYEYWTRSIETAWNGSLGFSVKVLIVGHDGIDDTLMKELKRDDQIWHIHTTLDPNQRPRYRAAFLSQPHFYTGAYPDTIAHEAGHELGLDDEYRENDKGRKNAWRDCVGKNWQLPGANYIMCVSSSSSNTFVSGQPAWWEPPYKIANPDWWTAPYAITNPEAAKAIYPWIITRRYVVGLAAQCFDDSDCDSDKQYCDKGGVAGVGRNQCVPRKKENDTCGADHQCLAPAICKGKPLGRCVTESTVGLNGKCTRDVQCKSGSCNKDGLCQCAANTDCGSNQYCDKGGVAGIGRNQCVRKKTENEKCGADSQCISPATCKNGRCVTENSVDLLGSCSRDSQCKSGSCDNNGICQCTRNTDCGDGRRCKKGVLGVGRNVCVKD